MSLEADTAFTLANFILASNDDPGGVYPYPFVISEIEIDEGMFYNCTIPIPTTLLLFGSGLLGLMGIKRKIRS